MQTLGNTKVETTKQFQYTRMTVWNAENHFTESPAYRGGTLTAKKLFHWRGVILFKGEFYKVLGCSDTEQAPLCWYMREKVS